MAGIATLLAGVWLLRRSIGGARHPPLRLAAAMAASLPLWACALWTFAVLGPSE